MYTTNCFACHLQLAAVCGQCHVHHSEQNLHLGNDGCRTVEGMLHNMVVKQLEKPTAARCYAVAHVQQCSCNGATLWGLPGRSCNYLALPRLLHCVENGI